MCYVLITLPYVDQVTNWSREEYGKFYNGDSYIILNTYKNPDSDVSVDGSSPFPELFLHRVRLVLCNCVNSKQ